MRNFPNYQLNITQLFQNGTTLSAHGKCELILTRALSGVDVGQMRDLIYTDARAERWRLPVRHVKEGPEILLLS